MFKFAELFPDVEIRATVSHELEKLIKLTPPSQLVRHIEPLAKTRSSVASFVDKQILTQKKRGFK
jgi:hypothetical protein